MKRLRYFFYLSAFCFTIIYGCKKTNNADLPDQSPNKTIAINNCSSITGSSLPVICFESVITDSRCPSDAVCIWAGYAAIKLSIKDNAGLVQYFSLSTLASANHVFPPNDTLISGYHVKLISLLPYPITSAPQPYPYKATLQITK